MNHSTINLVPMPRSLHMADGTFDTAGLAWEVEVNALANVAIAFKLAHLAPVIHEMDDSQLYVVSIGEPKSTGEPPDESQGYRLTIDPGGVRIVGSDEEGLFWGLMTLEQLLESGPCLPCLEIEDWPQLPLRLHHDDISRGQVSKLDDFRRIIRHLSRYKISHYGLYIEDILHLESFPDIGVGRGKLMPNEVRAIVAEGELNNVEIVPIFQMIGHQENMLRLPQYAHLGREVFQSMSSLDPDKPAVREFLTKALDDVCALFPSQLFCMGFDETQGIDCATFIRHANWCVEQLVSRGRTPIMWADMFANHFGYEAVKELHPAIILVNWEYDSVEPPIPHQAEFEATGRPVMGYASYSNWSGFLPDFAKPKKHLQAWEQQLSASKGGMFACSMWGGEGYECSRDICWNLFAFFGETAWSGADTQPDTFESRFQSTFYGAELPELTELIDGHLDALTTPPGKLYAARRRNVASLFRSAQRGEIDLTALESDRKYLERALEAVDRARKLAVREVGHLDHFEVSLRRMLSVVNRLAFAGRHWNGAASPTLNADISAIIAEMEQVKDRYAAVWLRHNKPEGLETSLAVFDEVAADFARAIEQPASDVRSSNGCVPLDLDGHFNEHDPNVDGVPIGIRNCEGIPFHFAPIEKTHVRLDAASGPLAISFSAISIRDLHIIASSPKPADACPRAALTVELRQEDDIVFTETMNSITHLCDWWAPRGEHMWAGGGLRHADQERVRFVLSANPYYGLTAVSRFAIPANLVADELVLTAWDTEVQIFAVTVIGDF